MIRIGVNPWLRGAVTERGEASLVDFERQTRHLAGWSRDTACWPWLDRALGGE